ncbi:unnamed protein product [Danaus chrysippus]|uniref:(African queen) hypothetical protein n=1 Tax=Danaus chrysippus TaxID=151541 RepID=A0A8J2MX18_9NEOP|nr:unnamed protein product [Danaus chrysippus]
MTSGTFLWVEDRFSQCNNYQAHESMRGGCLKTRGGGWDLGAVVVGDGRESRRPTRDAAAARMSPPVSTGPDVHCRRRDQPTHLHTEL